MTDPGGTGLSGPGAAAPARSSPLVGPAGSAGLERSIARVLTLGTYLSIALLAGGVVLMLSNGIGPLSGGPAFDPGTIAGDVLALRPAGFIWLGLIVVVATPSARVAASLIGYVRLRERMMAIVACLILLVIAVSVALAKGLEG
ncbi:MAG TPA: DUF1634 domain-containing protein [Candidatus Deferrimicrobium sp.]|nr:DUF1634 domain-containing protein [Candidatus Deferrimicrobium sp.]